MKKQDLLQALEIVKPGLAGTERIEQTTSFAFMGENVVTYNDDISVSHPVPGLNITGAIEAKELYNLLKKIKNDELEMELVENEIKITSGKVVAHMAIQVEIKLPLDEISEKGKWKNIPEGLMKAARNCSFSCENDKAKSTFCVHVNKDGFVEATDRFRINRYQLSAAMPVATFLIPSTSVREVAKTNRCGWNKKCGHWHGCT